MDDKKYKFFLIAFFVILALPLFTASPWFAPPAWGKTIVFRIIISILLFFIIQQILKGAKLLPAGRSLAPCFWSLAPLIALFGIFLLATIFSLDPYYSFWESPLRAGGFLNFSFYILFAILAFLFIKKSDWQKIWLFSIFIGVLVSIIAIFQQYKIFSETIIPYGGRPPSTMGGPIFLALYLLLLSFLTLSFALKEKQIKKKVFYTLAFLLFISVILFTGSRAAYIGLLIGFIYFILCYPKKQRMVVLLKILFLILLIAGVYGIYYLNTELKPFTFSGEADSKLPKYLEKNEMFREFLDRFSINLALEDPRFSTWVISLEAIKEKPILGYGPENFSIAFDKHYDPLLPYISKEWGSWYDKAHNFLFDISVTAGVPALLIYLSLFGSLFWGLQKIKKKRPEQTLICHGIQACFFGYLTANLFGFDVFSNYLILFLIIGYSLSLINPVKLSFEQSKESKPLWKSGFVFILFCILILFIWLGNLKPLSINKEINWADYYIKTGQCEKAIKQVETNILPSQSIIDSYAKLKYIEIIGKCSAKIPELKLALAGKAISVLKQTAEIRPYYTRTWLFLGTYTNLLIENSEYLKIKTKNVEELKKQANAYFEKAEELSSKREQLFISWLQTDLLSENYQAAKEKAEQCIKFNPESSYCWWLKGLCNIYLEEIEQAEKNLKIAAEKGHKSDSQKSLSQLVKAYLRLAEETGNLKYYEKAVDIWIETDLLSEKYQAAKEKAEQCIKFNPESSYCWWLKGLCNIYLEEIEQAEKNLKIAAEKGHKSDSQKSLSQLVKAYTKLIEKTGDLKYYEKTVNIWQKLVLIDPDNYQYYDRLAHAYEKLGEYEKFADMYQKLILIEPDNYNYQDSLAYAYLILKEYEKAFDIYQKLVLIEPDNDKYHHSLAYTYSMLKEYKKAADIWQKLVLIKPDHCPYYNYLGHAYEKLGEYEKALDIYQKLVSIEPVNYNYHYSLAHVYKILGEYEKAKEQALIVIELMPDLKEDVEKFLRSLAP